MEYDSIIWDWFVETSLEVRDKYAPNGYVILGRMKLTNFDKYDKIMFGLFQQSEEFGYIAQRDGSNRN